MECTELLNSSETKELKEEKNQSESIESNRITEPNKCTNSECNDLESDDVSWDLIS